MTGERCEDTVGSTRGVVFGTVADQYERYRLDYPDELVDAVTRYAGALPATALEVGAGTGKATRLFASHGVRVTALEPDAEMARLLERGTRDLPVETVVSTFEGFASRGPFDLLLAAASWHWTDPGTRWTRAVQLLTTGGVLALFRRQTELQDPDLSARIQDLEDELLPHGDPAVAHAWSPAHAAATDGLGDVRQHDLPAVVTMPADDYLGRLGTVSAYLALDPPARTDALHRIRAVLPDRVAVDTSVQLTLARRV